MAGVISIRFSKDERALLRRRWREGGFPSLSAYVRTQLGLDAVGGMDPVTEYEEIDSVRVLQAVVEVRDRLDNVTTALNQISRHLGIRTQRNDEPRQYPHVPPAAPPDDDGIMDIPDEYQERTSVLPDGFTTVVEL